MSERALSGRLEDLTPEILLQLISSTGASGLLHLTTAEREVEICFTAEGICAGSRAELEEVAAVLDASEGSYSFIRKEMPGDPHRVLIDAGEFLAALRSLAPASKAAFASEVDVESLVAGHVMAIAERVDRPEIHVLADAPVAENPLEDLLVDLEETAPDELMMTRIAVMTVDPRPWRRGLQREWKRRAWKIEFFGDPLDVPQEHFDLVTIHHQLSMTRVGSHDDWIALVERLTRGNIPVVGVGPLGDPMWVARLVEAGVGFLLPPPQGDAGESWKRFGRTLTHIVERLLDSWKSARLEPGTAPAIVELVDGLLHGAESQYALASFLQLASVDLHRGAILVVEPTRLRCRAGFGYPDLDGGQSLPRGLGLLERVIRTGESFSGIDGGSAAALQLSRVLGLESLPDQTVLIPLLHRTSVAGIFVGDREGRPLPELRDLNILARRLGGVFV